MLKFAPPQILLPTVMAARTRSRFPTPLAVDRSLNTLLEGYYPPPASLCEHGLGRAFRRRHDDTDGERGPEQEISLGFSPDGDAWLLLAGLTSLRFRIPAGGGSSPRVQRALVILAEAIRRDNEERPQQD